MTRVKAKRNCKFGCEGTEYVFKEGEEQDIDVPIEQISLRSFEILGERAEVKINKKEKKEKKELEGGD